MSLKSLTTLFLCLFSFSASAANLCPHIFLRHGDLKLDKNEKVLVCGDGENETWKEVPLEQSRYHLKILLQNQGYFQPSFEIRNSEMWVDMGPQTKIQTWELVGNPPIVDKERKRKVIGEAMTPEKLNEIEKWIDNQLNAQGYACPKLTTEAKVWSSDVQVTYFPGRRQQISLLERKGLETLDEDIFRRYQAFDGNKWYDNRKLQITSNRLLTDGIVQSSYFTHTCEDDGVHLVHHLEVGEPRILRIGFGASTEEFPFMDIWFKNTRIDSLASSYWILAHASPILQSIEGSSELYILPWSKESFLGPRFRTAREREDAFEILTGKTGIDIGRNWDWNNNRLGLRAGPTVNYLNTIRGIGPDDVSFVTVEGTLTAMSHDYELLAPQQSTGYQGSLSYQGQRKGLGSPLSAEKWTFRLKNLWNINELSPPLFVLGARLESTATSTDAVDRSTEREVLPPEYRIFLGGEQNLRGFARQTLNNRGFGYLTSIYLGFEIRLIEQLRWNLEPLILWDLARAGETSWTLDEPVFQSVGAGLRWRSPFGTIRFTAAKGSVIDSDLVSDDYIQQWVYLFGFGREF